MGVKQSFTFPHPTSFKKTKERTQRKTVLFSLLNLKNQPFVFSFCKDLRFCGKRLRQGFVSALFYTYCNLLHLSVLCRIPMHLFVFRHTVINLLLTLFPARDLTIQNRFHKSTLFAGIKFAESVSGYHIFQ